MTDYVTYRETVEYTVALRGDDHEAEGVFGDSFREAENVKSISREVIGRRHEPDYALDCDMDAELYILLEDGKRIFESRSHDAVLDKLGSLGKDVSRIFRFEDLDDPDKSWKICKPSAAAPATGAAR